MKCAFCWTRVYLRASAQELVRAIFQFALHHAPETRELFVKNSENAIKHIGSDKNVLCMETLRNRKNAELVIWGKVLSDILSKKILKTPKNANPQKFTCWNNVVWNRLLWCHHVDSHWSSSNEMQLLKMQSFIMYSFIFYSHYKKQQQGRQRSICYITM